MSLKNIQSLPDECLCRVFQLVDFETKAKAVQAVCHRWHKLLRCPLARSGVWGVVTIKLGFSTSLQKQLTWFAGVAAGVAVLQFRALRQPWAPPLEVHLVRAIGMVSSYGAYVELCLLEEVVDTGVFDRVLDVGAGQYGAFISTNVRRLQLECGRSLPSRVFGTVGKLAGLRHLQFHSSDGTPAAVLNSEAATACLAALTGLQSLKLGCCSVCGSLASLSALTQLTQLHLSFGDTQHLASQAKMQDFGKAVAPMKRLKSLHVSAEPGPMPLQIANAFLEPAMHVMKALPQLPALTDLGLLHCRLSGIPKEVLGLRNLRCLTIMDQHLGSAGARASWCRAPLPTTLQELRLNHCGIKQLPTAIANAFHLKRLDLRLNELTELPTRLAGLSRLEQLDLSFNSLRGLPPQISQLTALTSLRHLDIKLQIPDPLDFLLALPNLKQVVLYKDTSLWDPQSAGNLGAFEAKLVAARLQAGASASDLEKLTVTESVSDSHDGEQSVRYLHPTSLGLPGAMAEADDDEDDDLDDDLQDEGWEFDDPDPDYEDGFVGDWM